MKRKPVSLGALFLRNPSRARPEELKFDVFDSSERRIGEFACTTFEIKITAPIKVAMTTPWGQAAIDYQGSRPTIVLNGHELAALSGSLFKGGFDLTFPGGRVLKMTNLKGGKNNIEFADGNCHLVGVEEKGTLPEGAPGRSPQPTLEEIKMMPKADRPRTIETRDYRQFRISTSGTFPVNEDDLVRSLAIFASFGMIIDETTG